MTPIRRYKLPDDNYWGGSVMRDHPKGDFVLYTDHIAALEAALAEHDKSRMTSHASASEGESNG